MSRDELEIFKCYYMELYADTPEGCSNFTAKLTCHCWSPVSAVVSCFSCSVKLLDISGDWKSLAMFLEPFSKYWSPHSEAVTLLSGDVPVTVQLVLGPRSEAVTLLSGDVPVTVQLVLESTQ